VNEELMATANFCGQCGTQIPVQNKFCTSCGTPSGVHLAVTPAMAVAALGKDTNPAPTLPTADLETNGHAVVGGSDEAVDGVDDDTVVDEGPPPVTGSARGSRTDAPAPRERGTSRRLVLGGVGAALAVVAVLLVVLVTGGGGGKATQATQSPTQTTIYKQQVAKAFGPVLGANEQVSAKLVALKGTQPDSARLSVRQAQQATTTAAGALSALTVPTGQSALSNAAQQVVDREVAYLAAVASVLGHPTVAGASQLQTLSSNLTSALHAAGPTIAGEQESVSGADRLTSWARTTSRTLNRRAAAKRAKAKRARERTNAGATGSGGGSSTASTPRGNSCGGGVYAGAATSCAFALNVRDAYAEAPGAVATVRVYSPVTDTTYTMDCRPSGNGVTCSGGNGASVSF
jgi:hypothetical protein